ncbi:MAG TPA: cyanophycin synthetase, partial [Azospira sp.]|nr:cyanophycin synthetase [Azospira sp.]
FAAYWQEVNAKRRVYTFGLEHAADVSGKVQRHGLETRIELTSPKGNSSIRLRVPGLHNARNAVAAAAAALAGGISLAAVVGGLEAFRGVKGRLQQKTAAGGAIILDDTYNANPDSVRAGIDVLAATVGRQLLILGDMGEIGAMSGQYHDEIGGYAKSQGVDQLHCLGEASAQAARNFGAGGHHYKNIEDLVKAVQAELTPDTTVLVKGSRFMKMERVVDALVAPAASTPNSQENS